MEEYTDLQAAFEAAIVAAGLVVSPLGPDPEVIPGRGAGSWVGVLIRTAETPVSDGTNIAVDVVDFQLGSKILTSFDQHLAQKTANDFVLAMREAVDTGAALAGANANITELTHTVDIVDDGSALIPRVVGRCVMGVNHS